MAFEYSAYMPRSALNAVPPNNRKTKLGIVKTLKLWNFTNRQAPCTGKLNIQAKMEPNETFLEWTNCYLLISRGKHESIEI